jgi:hypothetical protein
MLEITMHFVGWLLNFCIFEDFYDFGGHLSYETGNTVFNYFDAKFLLTTRRALHFP